MMEQIKRRIKVIEDTIALIAANKHYAGTMPAAEFCLLQLRYCCELIAIGCIAVHTDVPRSKRLVQELWNAGQIIKSFEKIKPEFFPTPVKDEPGTNGVPVFRTGVEGSLSKAELIKMYNEFGDMLHAGTFQDFLNPKQRVRHLAEFADFTNKIVRLLNIHTYTLYDQEKLIRVVMKNDIDGKVAWSEFQRLGPSPTKQ